MNAMLVLPEYWERPLKLFYDELYFSGHTCRTATEQQRDLSKYIYNAYEENLLNPLNKQKQTNKIQIKNPLNAEQLEPAPTMSPTVCRVPKCSNEPSTLEGDENHSGFHEEV